MTHKIETEAENRKNIKLEINQMEKKDKLVKIQVACLIIGWPRTYRYKRNGKERRNEKSRINCHNYLIFMVFEFVLGSGVFFFPLLLLHLNSGYFLCFFAITSPSVVFICALHIHVCPPVLSYRVMAFFTAVAVTHMRPCINQLVCHTNIKYAFGLSYRTPLVFCVRTNCQCAVNAMIIKKKMCMSWTCYFLRFYCLPAPTVCSVFDLLLFWSNYSSLLVNFVDSGHREMKMTIKLKIDQCC